MEDNDSESLRRLEARFDGRFPNTKTHTNSNTSRSFKTDNLRQERRRYNVHDLPAHINSEDWDGLTVGHESNYKLVGFSENLVAIMARKNAELRREVKVAKKVGKSAKKQAEVYVKKELAAAKVVAENAIKKAEESEKRAEKAEKALEDVRKEIVKFFENAKKAS